MTNVSLDAHVAETFITNNQLQNLFRLVLAGNNPIKGYSGNDALYAYGVNNSIMRGGGNDLIDGGTGIYTAVYAGTHTDYSFQQLDGLVQVADLRPGSPNGADQDTNIQFFQIADGTYSLTSGQLIPQQMAATIQATNLGILRAADTVADATTAATSINSGQLTFANDVNHNSSDFTFSTQVTNPIHTNFITVSGYTSTATASYSTLTYPYDCICYITDFIGGVLGQGSGVIIGPHTILTASHMLWDADLGLGASAITVTPGYSLGGQPIAGQWAIHYFQINDSHDLISKATSQQDFAVIDFASNLSSFGSFGIQTIFPEVQRI